MTHLSMDDLLAGLPAIQQSPRDEGRLEAIVRRPAVNEREDLDAGDLSPDEGLVGDSWRLRAGSRTADGTPDRETQLNVMNARTIALVAQDRSRWAQAGDQLFVDLDLSVANLPPGTRLALGSAVIEVTNEPHTGCQKFVKRFGLDAVKFVNSPVGKDLRLRGLNAKVVQAGAIRVGDIVRKIGPV